MFKTKRRIAAVATVGALALAGVAIAAWTVLAIGQGGKGNIGTIQAPTVSNPTTSAADACYPGQTCNFEVQVTNPNPAALVLTAYDPGIAVATIRQGAVLNTACSGGSPFPVTLASLSGLSIPIPAGTTTVTLPGAWSLNGNAPTQCAGSTVSVDSTNQVQYTFATP